MKTEVDDDEEEEEIAPPVVSSPSRKAPAPPPPPPPPSTSIEPIPTKRTISQSAGENIYSSDEYQSRRALNRQNHQRHGSADLLCRQSNHEHLNRSSTINASFHPSESYSHRPFDYEYDENVHHQQRRNSSSVYIEQLEHELKLTKEQLNATMKSIKTFWSPELKKERSLRKDESCRYQLLVNEHQKHSKQVRRNRISLMK